MKTNPQLLATFRLLLGIILVVWFLATIDISEATKSLTSFSLETIGLWIAANLAARLLSNEAHLICIRFLDPKQPRITLLLLGFVRSMGNYITPFLGTTVYATALRDRVLLPVAKIAPFMTMQSIVAFSTTGLLAVFGMILHFRTESLPWLIPLILVAGSSTLTWTAANSRIGSKLAISQNKWVRSAVMGFSLAENRICKVSLIHLIHLVAPLIRGSRLVILLMALGINLSFPEALLLIIVAEASMLIQVTPGNIGVREGAILFAGSALGIDPPALASVAIADRGLSLAFTGILGSVSTFFLAKSNRTSFYK